ncbi:hypothetical protein [Antrihabitans cavernicola]|uniref:hypothetical protein n=1 Tax=Antrihabitans cavernicola TaxID=2495913 RepID=UPI001658F421|nr:hypothetical protein [Spelaeibacter cavernicola]
MALVIVGVVGAAGTGGVLTRSVDDETRAELIAAGLPDDPTVAVACADRRPSQVDPAATSCSHPYC